MKGWGERGRTKRGRGEYGEKDEEKEGVKKNEKRRIKREIISINKQFP